jgi:hypothetical protein
MSNRETEWKVKQLTPRADQGMLHERQQDADASKYKALMVEHHSEAYVLETFVNKPSKPKINHRPSNGLRHKQTRNVFMMIFDNIFFFVKACFNLCAMRIEQFLTILLPAQEAKEVGILATAMAMTLLVFGAANEAPAIYSTLHHIQISSVLSEIRSLL